MKITKLIIPILGLSQINNKELLQIEKTPEISYEVSATDNWDNYFYLTNTNATEIRSKVNIIYEGAVNVGGYSVPADSPDFGCGYILQKLAQCWQIPDPVAATACSAFWAALALAGGC